MAFPPKDRSSRPGRPAAPSRTPYDSGHGSGGGGKPVEDGRIWGIVEEWPKDLQLRLEDIPMDGLINNESLSGKKGLDVPTSDVEKHREFFKRLFYGGASYREGEYIYSGLQIWFH